MKKHLAVPAAVILMLVFGISGVSADTDHYNNILIGDRAAGMGGAYRAVSDDSSASYYNPAGLALTFEDSLSASVNAVSIKNTTYKGVFGSDDWHKSSSTYLGNFIGFTRAFGKGKLGLSIAIPDSELIRQDDVVNDFTVTAGNIDTYKLNMGLSDTSYLFGPSYGIEFNEKVAIGATLYLHHRSYELNQSELIFFDDSQYEVDNTHIVTREDGFRPIIGLIFTPKKRLSVGLTWAQTMITSSSTSSQAFIKRYNVDTALWDPDNQTGQSYTKVDNNDKRKTPTEISVAVAYFPSDYLLLSADYTQYSKPDDDYIATYNVAVGAEYYIDNNMIVRGGLFTNNANTPSIESGLTNQSDHVDLIGGSLALALTSRTSSMTIGINHSMGSGEGQVIGGSTRIQDIDTTSTTIFLAGSYHM